MQYACPAAMSNPSLADYSNLVRYTAYCRLIVFVPRGTCGDSTACANC
jgi:hypothetical protein